LKIFRIIMRRLHHAETASTHGRMTILALAPKFPAPAPAPTLKKVAEFDLPGPSGKRFDYLTIDPDDHYLISAHLAAGHTYVIDLHANKVVGADDYLTKPFAFEVFLARLRSVARRGSTPRPMILDFVREGVCGRAVARSGNPRWCRITELRARTANSAFHFDVTAVRIVSVCETTMRTRDGLPRTTSRNTRTGCRPHDAGWYRYPR